MNRNNIVVISIIFGSIGAVIDYSLWTPPQFLVGPFGLTWLWSPGITVVGAALIIFVLLDITRGYSV